MITVIKEGQYELIETKGHTKVLTFDKKDQFAWVNAAGIGEILVASHRNLAMDHILARSRYRLYDVKDEPKLTDLLHLELYVGNSLWQGYLLPNGLPDDKKRRRIIPTKETITKATH